MSIFSNLQNTQNALYSLAIDNWQLNLASSELDFTVYENAVQQKITAFTQNLPSDITNTLVQIPIVFHLINDTTIDPIGENFNIVKVLNDINEVFASAHINFVPVTNFPNSNIPLSSPGINQVNGSALAEVREVNELVGNIREYKEEGLCLDSKIYTVPSTTAVVQNSIGYSESSLIQFLKQENVWYKETAVLNVILVNNIIGEFTILGAPNPYNYDVLGTKFHITLPFYALGSPVKYEYKYTNDTKAQKAVLINLEAFSGQYATSIQYFGRSNHKAKPLLKGLGYALGLASSNSFNLTKLKHPNFLLESCNEGCIYTDLHTADYAASCDRLPANKYYYPYYDITNEVIQDNYHFEDCTSSFMLELPRNIMSYYIDHDVDFYPSSFYQLHENQILRIRANLTMSYIETSTGVPYKGILKKLTSSSIPVTINYNNDEIIDEETTIELLCENGRSLNNNINISSNENAFNIIRKINHIRNISNG